MKVRAIETSTDNHITEGQEYDAVDAGDYFAIEADDIGRGNHVFKYRFEVVQEVKAAPLMGAGLTSEPMLLPADPAERKGIPLTTGVLDYFPLALAEVARLSKVGNDQHNPGQPLHWDKTKSTDHADTIGRHLIDRGRLDADGMRHSAKLAWRALALLQTELEAAQA